MTYRLAFLIGGVVFALVSYMTGTILYQIELDITRGFPLSTEAISTALNNMLSHHLLTFVPWMIGTTGLAILLGHQFDRERQLRRVVEALSVTDSLTLLYNRRYLLSHLSRELGRIERQVDSELAVLMIDIDDFKQHNDTHGHLAGDYELRQVAASIRQVIRQTDVVARYGGEEMVVVSIGSDKDGALTLAERIRQAVKDNCSVTISVGVSSFPENGDTVDALIRAADEAMYEAKRRGKDQVVAATPTNGDESTPSD
jgi:diguanylate cyclase (GGDEF)-like protein